MQGDVIDITTLWKNKVTNNVEHIFKLWSLSSMVIFCYLMYTTKQVNCKLVPSKSAPVNSSISDVARHNMSVQLSVHLIKKVLNKNN